MMMMMLLLFLSACVSVGLSYDYLDTYRYGNTYKIYVGSLVYSVEFLPKGDSLAKTILWQSDNPEAYMDTRRKMEMFRYVIYNVTQKDSGQYISRNKEGIIMSTKNLEVEANMQNIHRMSGGQFNFSFNLNPDSCNIYFFPDIYREIRIVQRGALELGHQSDCTGFNLLKPCGVSIEAVQMSCAGHFEVKDHNNDKALTVSLEIEPSKVNSTYISVGVASLVCALLSCCLKYCCCGKSSSKKDSADAEADAEAYADAAPANNENPPVYQHQYDPEPVQVMPNQPTESSETLHPTETSQSVTDPLIHHPATEPPPPYFWVSALDEQTDADREPQFTVKGINFDLNTNHTDVYTSDKLNFL